MKKTLIIVITIIIIELIILSIYFIIKNNDYTKELKNDGYTDKEIEYIEENIPEEEITDENIELINKFKESEVFNIENLERYQKYYKENNYIPKETVMYVEIGLDQEFYTNINEITNYDDTLVLVNKYNKLPKNFKAKDLVTLEETYSKRKQKMKKVAADSIMEMINKAKEEGYNLNIISGYRTEDYQNMLFTNSTTKNGLVHALMYSAKPGHSEHQTGLAADFNIAEESFDKTKEYEWLKENAHTYGFIERYPKDKEFITGYGYEPWHYRYVGIDVAKKIKEEQITFEEYYVKYLRSY